jgi:hypothetical protein
MVVKCPIIPQAFRWNAGTDQAEMLEYGRTREGEPAAAWQRTPLYHLVETNQSVLRRRLTDPIPADGTPDFATFAELRSEGMTDYLALVTRLAATGAIGEMDAIYSVWTSNAADGFSAGDIDSLQRLVSPLAAALKCRSLARIAATLVETYLGRDAGRRVLSGRAERGIAERINAVLWFSDLRGFTRITDTAAPDQIIPLLNDYAANSFRAALSTTCSPIRSTWVRSGTSTNAIPDSTRRSSAASSGNASSKGCAIEGCAVARAARPKRPVVPWPASCSMRAASRCMCRGGEGTPPLSLLRLQNTGHGQFGGYGGGVANQRARDRAESLRCGSNSARRRTGDRTRARRVRHRSESVAVGIKVCSSIE